MRITRGRRQAADPSVGCLAERPMSPMNVAWPAIPSVGFTHSPLQWRAGAALLIDDEHIAHLTRSQRRQTASLVDLGAAAYITMAVVFGPLLVWLIFA